jgi:tripartite-type tricarboxylate transporter receptor subunit TctC
MTAVIAGNVDTAFTDTITSAPQIATNSLRAIAISSRTRSPTLPDVPTVAESGVPELADFEVLGWNGIVVKTGTAADRIKLLNEHIRRALSSPDVVERISKLGADVAADTPEQFGEFMRNEDAKWGNLAKTAKLAAVE